MSAFQAPTGTRDILAPESARVERLVATFASIVERAGFGLLLSPMFEDVGVFQRGVGVETDVVRKEMYEFEDKGGRALALRPEGTASAVRAYIQHRPQTPWKAWYVTPAFRHEKPQAGRFRQHHQLGVEAIGSRDPDLDFEVIAILAEYFAAVGLRGLDLRVNSMGDETCLPGYKEALSRFLVDHVGALCDEHRHTWSRNPLRVLDCKRPECLALRERAPRLVDWLCEPCREHLGRVTEGLDAVGIAWRRDDFLVRGLDYYTRTTFEFAAPGLESAQNAVGGGGRYDGLVEALGGPSTPGVGFASGIERVLLALDASGVDAGIAAAPSVFVVDLVGGTSARDLTTELRRAGISSDRAFDDRSLKAQLRQADRSGALFCAIVGKEELESDTVTLKRLRADGDSLQERMPRGLFVERISELVGA